MRRSYPVLSLIPVALLACRSAPLAEADPASSTRSTSAEAVAASRPPGTWTRTPPPAALETKPVVPPAVTRSALPNGLRIVVVEQHRRPVAVVSLVLPRGALTDPPSDSGLTYLAVKLAGDYYEWSAAGEQLFEEKSFRRQVADIGGSARFEVESDFSMVRISGYAPDAREYIRMIAEAVARPRHGGRTFTARRNATIDAIEDLESSDPEAMQQLVANAAFGPGHPYARALMGTVDSLTPLGQEDVANQQLDVLVPAGGTLLVVGDVRPDAVTAAAKAAFGRWTGESSAMPSVPSPSVHFPNSQVGYLERRAASTLLVCASRPLPDVYGADAALDVLTAILGHGAGSRLGATLRDRHGLTYWTSAQIVRRRQARAFVACSPLRADQADLGVRLFREILDHARETPPTDEEVQRAKALRLAELDSAYDDAFSATNAWLRAIVVGPGSPRTEEERAEIARVTAADVQKLARTILSRKSTRWVVSGDKVAATRAIEANKLGQLHRIVPGR